MISLLNYIAAWLTVAIGLFLSCKYVVRKLAASDTRHKKRFQRWNKALRFWHIWLGIAMIGTGIIHGLLSSQNLFSINFGTANLFVSVLLGLSYFARKLFASGKTWLILHRILTVVFLPLIVLHVHDVGGARIFTQIHNVAFGSENSESPINHFGTQLADGTYRGSATGFRPGLTVEVQVENNQVTKITVISHNEAQERFYGRPINEIPNAIIQAQSLDVDVVSGATYTSNGIINAVRNALSDASAK